MWFIVSFDLSLVVLVLFLLWQLGFLCCYSPTMVSSYGDCVCWLAFLGALFVVCSLLLGSSLFSVKYLDYPKKKKKIGGVLDHREFKFQR